MMSDSEEQMVKAIDDLARDVGRVTEAGVPLLTGPVAASLSFNVDPDEEGFITPVSAAHSVMTTIMRFGFDALTFAVLDKGTGEEYLVRGGQLVTEAQLREELERARERDDV